MDETERRSDDVSDLNNVLEVYDGVCSLEDEDPVPRPGDRGNPQSQSSGTHTGKQ